MLTTVISTAKALSDAHRVRVLAALRDRRELCVCQITELLGLATATVSRHMSLLQAAQLVDSRKEGRWVYYRLSDSYRGADSSETNQEASAETHPGASGETHPGVGAETNAETNPRTKAGTKAGAKDGTTTAQVVMAWLDRALEDDEQIRSDRQRLEKITAQSPSEPTATCNNCL